MNLATMYRMPLKRKVLQAKTKVWKIGKSSRVKFWDSKLKQWKLEWKGGNRFCRA